MKTVLALLSLVALGALPALSGCVDNPATRRKASPRACRATASSGSCFRC